MTYKIVERLESYADSEHGFGRKGIGSDLNQAASLIQELGEVLEKIANSPSPNCVVMPRRDFGFEGYPGDKVIARAALTLLDEARK